MILKFNRSTLKNFALLFFSTIISGWRHVEIGQTYSGMGHMGSQFCYEFVDFARGDASNFSRPQDKWMNMVGPWEIMDTLW